MVRAKSKVLGLFLGNDSLALGESKLPKKKKKKGKEKSEEDYMDNMIPKEGRTCTK